MGVRRTRHISGATICEELLNSSSLYMHGDVMRVLRVRLLADLSITD